MSPYDCELMVALPELVGVEYVEEHEMDGGDR
jgi:hypothetical protein